MKQIFRTFTRAGYVHAAKPLMFRKSPDAVHRGTVGFGRKVQRIPLSRQLIAGIWQHSSAMLSQQIHGLTFPNPVGLSAGFDKNAELLPLMESVGFGFVTGGSITGYRCEGNSRPWFHRLPEQRSIVVHAGLPNMGSATISRRLAKDTLLARRHVPLFLSVARTNTRESSTELKAIADYALALKNLRRYADVFEINISCPNTYGGEPFTTPARLRRLLTSIDALKLKQPVFIKMPSNLPWSEYEALLDEIVVHDVQGVTISNLRKDRTGMGVDESIKGNLSGAPTKALSDELIARTYGKYGDKLTIIGVGGIFTARDAYDKIKNGASLVALVTGLIYEGPQLVGQINKDLEVLLRADGYTHISQAIGSAAKDAHDHKRKN